MGQAASWRPVDGVGDEQRVLGGGRDVNLSRPGPVPDRHVGDDPLAAEIAAEHALVLLVGAGKRPFRAGGGVHTPEERPVHLAAVVRLALRGVEGRSSHDIDRLAVAGHGHLLGLHPPVEMLFPADRAVLAHADQAAFAFLDGPQDHDIGSGAASTGQTSIT